MRRRGAPVIAILLATVAGLWLTAVAAVIIARNYPFAPTAWIAGLWPGKSTPASTAPAIPPTSEPSPSAQPPTAPAARSVATPDRIYAGRAWQLWSDAAPAVFDPSVALPQTFHAARPIPPGYDIIDGATLQAEDLRIRLAGIVPLPAGAICVSQDAKKFACGLMARASLSLLAKAGRLSCYPDQSLERETPLYLCQAGGRDLAQAQVEAGFALPAQPSLAAMSGLAAAARAAHAGAWNGDWVVIPSAAAP